MSVPTILNTEDLRVEELSKDQTLWAYNGLDCCITREIYDALAPKVAANCQHTYDFERGMIAPAMTMMRRGMYMNKDKAKELLKPLGVTKGKLEKLLNRLAQAVWDKPLNHNSPVQLQEFLYKQLGIEPIIKFVKGKRKISTDRETLEKIRDTYPRAKVIASTILALRDTDKQISVLNSQTDEDGRIRCSYNVAGTETGRWSSSESAFRTGTNLQNVTPVLREVFEADPGYTMFYADLEQAESRVVAYLSQDEGYINACESGDLHTTVVKMVWPDLPWTGDDKADRKIADRPYYLHFSYRDMCKRAGHGTNYGLQPASLQRHLKIQQRYAWRFNLMYLGGMIGLDSLERWHKQDPDGGFDELIEQGEIMGAAPKAGSKEKRLVKVAGAFPGIRSWHDNIATALETEGRLTTPFGRTRQFWGRPSDAATLREAIAFVPQSTVGDLLNVGLYRIWSELEPTVQTLGQVHDAVLGQVPNKKLDEHLDNVLECMVNPLMVNGRMMTIPSSIEIGHNWGKFNDDPKKGPLNTEGMKSR